MVDWPIVGAGVIGVLTVRTLADPGAMLSLWISAAAVESRAGQVVTYLRHCLLGPNHIWEVDAAGA